MTAPTPDDDRRDVVDQPARDPWLRRVGIVVGGGVAGAVVIAFAAGSLGASGTTVAAVLLLLLALTCGGAALLALGTALVDELRGRPVSRGRIVVGIVLFFAGAALMAMVAGVGG